ncbi:MAG: carboxypeptidase-like regulatory domain-containing protein [Gammaproteobacteria bacterium]|nr:carboxypeptidase-like regulatory domain-containing protein [Gammaproteobacteria bacterium]
MSWTSVETNQFRLRVPELEEIELLVIHKNSVPLVKKISLPHQESGVVFDLSSGKSLVGTVLSEDEIPIPDAVLSFTCGVLPSIAIPEQAKPNWKTDSEGRFSISGLTIGECKVDVVARPDLKPQTFDLQIRSRRAKKDLVLADLFFVSGKVVDHQGDLVTDALVNGDVYPQSGWIETMTNEDGTFLLGPFWRGTTARLSAKHHSKGSTRTYQFVSGKHDILFRLSDMTKVIGTVVDARTGDPLKEFLLHARREHSGVRFPHEDTNGQISALVDTNSHSFAVEAPGYVPHWTDVRLFSGIDYDLGTVELKTGKTLTGRIYDAANDQPIAGAELFQFIDPGEVLFGSEGLRIRYFEDVVASKSNQDGTFEIGPLPYHEAELQVSAKGYVALKILVKREVETLDIPLDSWQPRKTRVRGVVQTNSGEPVKGMVQFNYPGKGGAGRGNNEDGSFDRGVSPGSLEVYANTKFGKTNTVRLHLRENETAEIILIVDRRGRLTGFIEGLRVGEEVGLQVYDSTRHHTRFGSYWSNGDFLVEGVPPGEYTVSAISTLNRYIEQSFEIHGVDGEAHVALIFRGDSRLYGSVEIGDRVGQEFRVIAQPRKEASTTGWSEVYDDGTYEIHGLEDGNYSVAVHQRSSSRSVDFDQQLGPQLDVVVQGDTRRDIPRIAGSHFVSGIVLPVAQAKGAIVFLSAHSGSISKQVDANEQGRFRFSGLEDGNYSLSVSVEGYVHYLEALRVGPSIEDHYVILEPVPQGSLYIAGTVHPADRSVDAFITIARKSDGASLKSVQVGHTGDFVIDQLLPDTYELRLYIKKLGFLRREVTLDSSIEDFALSYDSEKP